MKGGQFWEGTREEHRREEGKEGGIGGRAFQRGDRKLINFERGRMERKLEFQRDE
jgi:hypothetical protein